MSRKSRGNSRAALADLLKIADRRKRRKKGGVLLESNRLK
jgi:hypothetical protein